MFLSAVSPGFSLILDHRGRLGSLGRKVGSAFEEFELNEGVVYWVNVSDSSGAGSYRLSQKSCQTVVVVGNLQLHR